MALKYLRGFSLPLLLKHYFKKHPYSVVLILVLAIGFVLGSHHEPAAACGGFLCGPKEELTAALDQTDNSTDLINNGFLGMNAFVVFIIAIPLIAGAVKGVGRDEIGWYIGGSVVIFVLMLGLNYMGDWVFGIANGGGGGGGGTGGATGGG